MKNIKKLIIMVLVLAMSLTMLTAFASAAGTIAYGAATVTASALNIRSGPGTSNSIVGKVSRNSIVVVIEKTTSDWYEINYQGTHGFVSADYLTNCITAENFSAQGKVTSSGCRMRSKPNTSSTILGTYSAGTKMNVIGINTGWYKVQYDGKTGYMRSDLMDIIGAASASSSGSSTSSSGSSSSSNKEVTTSSSSSNSSKRDEIVNFALKYEGCRYVYGGESLSEGGFDCSGLVYFVYKTTYGYNMQRRASMQYAYNGKAISRSELQKGDLVFFSSDGSGVTHVGIYIGNNKFIHAATSSTGVVISDLSNSYYNRTYWGARNVIG